MSVHPAGDGAAWVEDVDVDQPHGLDYRYENHIAKAVRLRMEKGHAAFGDSTAGGEHIPGGAGVLGMELTNAGGDITSPVASDGTYQGRGLVWASDGSANSILWCSTAAAESTAATDWTVLAINPDKQWKGGDVSWQGNHQFDSSVQFYDPVDFSTAVRFDGTVDFTGSGVGFSTNTIFVDNTVVVDNVAGGGGVRVDCTWTHTTAVDFTNNTFSMGGQMRLEGAGALGTLTIVSTGVIDSTTGGLMSICGDVSADTGKWQIFGAETSQNGDGGDMTVGTVYHTTTDGFVIASDWSSTPIVNFALQVGDNSGIGPTDVIISDAAGQNNSYAGFVYPISACQYFCLSTNATPDTIKKYKWKPIGGGDLSAQ